MLPYGFEVVGGPAERRRPTDAAAAFRGYASLNTKVDFQREAFLSAFNYGKDFRSHLDSTGSTAGFSGLCWSPYIWFDIDHQELKKSLEDAGRLTSIITGRYIEIREDDLLLFFS